MSSFKRKYASLKFISAILVAPFFSLVFMIIGLIFGCMVPVLLFYEDDKWFWEFEK